MSNHHEAKEQTEILYNEIAKTEYFSTLSIITTTWKSSVVLKRFQWIHLFISKESRSVNACRSMVTYTFAHFYGTVQCLQCYWSCVTLFLIG